MELLKNTVISKGKVYPGNILKVDAFLNHLVDLDLIDKIADEFCALFRGEKITKVLTIEASGIAIAAFVAKKLGVPMLFAKKSRSKNISTSVYVSHIVSFTRGNEYDVFVSKEFLHSDDRVLLIDDFLANGAAIEGLKNIIDAAGAKLVGCGIVIEKAFQGGGDNIRKRGLRVESLVKVKSMSDNGLVLE